MSSYSLGFRLLLIFCSLVTLLFILARIRQAKMQIEDSLFWFFFSGFLLVLSIFPQIAVWAAKVLGLMAPINVVYLSVIFLLILKLFFMTLRISQLDSQVKSLAQKLALHEERSERPYRND